MKSIKTATLVVSLLALAQSQAVAQSPTPEQREKAQTMVQNCQDDLALYCEGVQPGGGRILECMEVNIEQLSPMCRESVQQVLILRSGGSN